MLEDRKCSLVSPLDPLSITLTKSQTPILVEAEHFQKLVQNLTAGKRKRKTVRFPEVEGAQKSSSQPAKVQKQVQTLLDYLDRLDQECPPPSKDSGNRGFFPTAGLVKGVNIEEGLQQLDYGSDSPPTPSNSTCDDSPEEPTSIRYFAKILTPLSNFPSSTLLCSEWDEGPGCLSPRSYQVMKHAQSAAKHLKTCGDISGSGPLKLSLEKVGDVERISAPSEWGYPSYPVDLLYYKGEITFVGQTEDRTEWGG